MKKSVLIWVAILVTSQVMAQKSELTSAILSFRKQDLTSARSYISAAEDKLTSGGTLKSKDLGKFWFNKGLIFSTIYDSQKDLDLLNIARDAYMQSIEVKGSSYVKKSTNELLRCVNIYNALAIQKYEAKEYADALLLFETVVDVNAYKTIGLVDTANLFNANLMAIEAKDSDKVIELSSRLIDVNPRNGDYHIYLIKELTIKDDAKARFEAVKRGRALSPNHTGLIFEEVNYYLSINDNVSLLSSLDQAIEAAPENKVLHFAKGTALGSLKRYDAAIEAYQDAISLDGDYFDANNNLASLFLDQTATLIDQMNNLGLSQSDQIKYNKLKTQRNNLYVKAKPFLKEAVRIDPNALQVLYALKDVCYQTDDMDCWKETNSKIKALNN